MPFQSILAFDSYQFMPHGHCVLWKPEILWPMVISEAGIFVSYAAIPAALIWFLRKRSDLDENGKLIIILFAIFIASCGLTHLVGAINYWNSFYFTEVFLKGLTAIVSIATAIVGFRYVPKLLRLPSPKAYKKMALELKELNTDLEKRVEERTAELKENQARLQSILNGVNDAISVYTPIFDQNGELHDFSVRALTERAMHQAGVTSMTPFNTPSLRKTHPTAFENGHFDRCAEVWKTGAVSIEDPYFSQVFNRYFRIVMQKCNEQNALLIFFSDVTEREQAKLTSMAQAKLVSLGEMAGGIGHEINTPLQVIDSQLRQLKRSLPDLGEKEERHIEKIETTLSGIKLIVANLRRLSREDSSEIKPTNIAETVDQLLSIFKRSLEEKNIELKKNIEVDRETKALASEVSLVQILTNLINNAVDAIDEKVDSEKAFIELNLKSFEDSLEIEVVDNGGGFDDKIKERIFDPLFTTKDVGKGTGLGLSLSQRMAMDMNSKINCQRDGGLTRFSFKLPKDAA